MTEQGIDIRLGQSVAKFKLQTVATGVTLETGLFSR